MIERGIYIHIYTYRHAYMRIHIYFYNNKKKAKRLEIIHSLSHISKKKQNWD